MENNGIPEQWEQSRSPSHTETIVWGSGEREFQRTLFLTPDLPPIHLVTSVRYIVCSGIQILTVTDRDGSTHILPGGRRERGEELEDTLQREILEETGITLSHLTPIGVLRYTHLLPQPATYPYPYPTFLQVVYTDNVSSTTPGNFTPQDDWVTSAEFRPVTAVRPSLPIAERILLDHVRAPTLH